MAKRLEGKRVLFAASRKTDEMTALVEKQGGTAAVYPAQGTVFLDEKEVEPDLRRLVEEGCDWFVFTTGIGTETLVNIAEKLGMDESFLRVIRHAKTAARGYKTRSALKKLGIVPLVTDDDGTTQGLVNRLTSFDFSGKKVFVQLHGDVAPKLIDFLDRKGAIHTEIMPYKHVPPEKKVLKALCADVLSGKTDAVCFTTAIQVRNLFSFAREQGCYDDMVAAFQTKVVATAVGKVTAEALSDEGVARIIEPEHQRMGAMIVALSHYYEQQ